MKKYRFLLLLLIFILAGVAARAQNGRYRQEYEAARALLEAGRNREALARLEALLQADPAHPLSPYTSFYFGVAAYRAGQPGKARAMFRQLLQQYPGWPQRDEARLWLARLSFEEGQYNQGLHYTALIAPGTGPFAVAREMKLRYLQQLEAPALEALAGQHPQDTVLVLAWVRKLTARPPGLQPAGLVDSLMAAYEIDSAALGLEVPPTVMKDRYRVAVLLPLFTERLWHSGVYMRKSLAVDLYEGMQLALEELDSNRLEVEVFDTRRDSLVVQEIISSGRLAEADAIIGPLYPQPVRAVAGYAYRQRKNFLNPLSTQSGILRHNPYAFLLRTGAGRSGRLLAGRMAAWWQEKPDTLQNRACAIFYGPRVSDSLAAYSYKKRIEADSFQVVIMQRATKATARNIYDRLTAAVKVVDSVKLRALWREGRQVRVLPRRDSLLLRVDSLGHIFVASDNSTIAAEVMAARISRGDTTRVIGLGNWLYGPNASLDLIESLGVWVAMQEYENPLYPDNLLLRERYLDRYHRKPTKYVYYGYHAMKWLAQSLLNYGVYFQHGYRKQGNLHEAFDYQNSRDNAHLLIYQLLDGRPVVLSGH